MAEFETIRPINLPQSQEVYDNDVFVIDSETGGVRKIPKDKVMTEIDDTLTETGQAADAKTVGDALNTINDTLDENIPLIQNPTKTVSGEVAHFTDGAEMPAKNVIVNIEPQQSGTGTPSPDNVRLFSGWESVSVYDTGVNLFDKDAVSSGKWLSTSTGLEESAANYCVSDYIPVKANSSVYIPATQTARRWFYDSKKNPTVYIGASGSQAYNPPSDGFIRVSILISGSGAVNLDTYQIEYGSAPTSYKTFGTTTPVNLGRTVYGGTLDVVSGVLTVDKAIRTIEFSQGQAITVDGVFLFRFTIVGTKDADHREDFECSHFYKPTSNISQSPANGMITNQYYNGYNMCIRNDALQTSSDWNTWLTAQINNGTPVQLVYPLVTPQTYTLTPTEVNTLLGENNVWADAGAVEVTYRRDINLALSELEQAIISLGSNV